VRSSKETRQFIFTTHNATIAVAGDSDVFMVLGADAEGGHLDDVGAIDSEALRPAVILHLEGGPKPYRLKKAKYGTDVQ